MDRRRVEPAWPEVGHFLTSRPYAQPRWGRLCRSPPDRLAGPAGCPGHDVRQPWRTLYAGEREFSSWFPVQLERHRQDGGCRQSRHGACGARAE
jgi:hypothetical protein